MRRVNSSQESDSLRIEEEEEEEEEEELSKLETGAHTRVSVGPFQPNVKRTLNTGI
jgi:hypothetical protein